MTFKRNILPDDYLTGNELTSALIGIGFRLFGKPPVENPNIENTIVAASIEGLKGDWRVQSLLVDWLAIHADKLLADRLTQLILTLDNKKFKKVKIFWGAFAQMKSQDSRFKKLLALVPARRLDILEEQTSFLIQKNGEDERFSKTCLRVPNKLLRHRPEDIMTPKELAAFHTDYHFRVLIGPTHRADMFAYFNRVKKSSTYALAKHCYGSYRTAMAVKKDYAILETPSKTQSTNVL